MSEDGFTDPFDEPSLEILVETLTGTSFEMKVYPADTVLDIKNKIYRVEGIPVHHQNLIFQMKELQDYVRLSDAGIVNGSTLKLVLSMRGGPISTRRLNTCDHHIIWKDLKDLMEQTRDDVGDKSGSKVSVLVFKEGEVINVIRVIENEDGSYSPYTDKAISPPHGRHRPEDVHQTFVKKINEDMEMATKINVLKSKMKKLRQQRNGGDKSRGMNTNNGSGDFLDLEIPSSGIVWDSKPRSSDRFKIYDGKIGEVLADQPENGEIALKEKHRSKARGSGGERASSHKSKESDNYFCKKLHVFEPDYRKDQADDDKILSGSILSPLYNRYSGDNRYKRPQYEFDDANRTEPLTLLNDAVEDTNAIEVPCAETLSLSARKRVHLTRLVLPEGERGKGSPDSIELEEKSPEMWEIQPETIKSSGAYKVGLLKRRTSVDHNYDTDFGVETAGSANLNVEHEDFNRQSSEYEVFGRNFYHVPQFVSTPSAIPPQYAPKDEKRIRDIYLGSPVPDAKVLRSPLYGRRSKNNTSTADVDYNVFSEEASASLENLGRVFDDDKAQNSQVQSKTDNYFNSGLTASGIDRLHNDFAELDYDDFDLNYADDFFGYYNSSGLDKILSCNHPRFRQSGWNELDRQKLADDAQLANEIKRLSFDLKIDEENRNKVQIETTKLEDLPAVVSKKRMRCGQCNKRLNITNIYNCRCGRIFCSQHRYSETHDCKYDYKTEGRKLLEQQNPLVTATKLTKF